MFTPTGKSLDVVIMMLIFNVDNEYINEVFVQCKERKRVSVKNGHADKTHSTLKKKKGMFFTIESLVLEFTTTLIFFLHKMMEPRLVICALLSMTCRSSE